VQQSDLYLTNAGLFASAGQGVLIDPCVYEREIVAWRPFAAQAGIQLTHLILSHSHWDHIFGPEHYPDLPVIAQAKYLELTQGEQAQRSVNMIMEWFASEKIDRPQPFTIPQPDQTFNERLELPIGEEVIQLVHVPGHAADQLAVYHPAGRLLWASDILSDAEIPYVSDSLAAYEQTLAMLAEFEVELLVPGHGSVAGTRREVEQRIGEDRAYLAELRGRVGQAIAAGQTIAETVVACADMVYRNREDNEIPHQRNVESAYIELAGPADRHKYGWSQFE
jgi:glyoxylase-like metal-dependent hydrolase (beta-lactamase superfamily II)